MKLTSAQRDLLIDHLDGTKIAVDHRIPHRYSLQRSLIARGFVRWESPVTAKFSIITEAGRSALCEILAEWAEAIQRASQKLPLSSAGAKLASLHDQEFKTAIESALSWPAAVEDAEKALFSDGVSID